MRQLLLFVHFFSKLHTPTHTKTFYAVTYEWMRVKSVLYISVGGPNVMFLYISVGLLLCSTCSNRNIFHPPHSFAHQLHHACKLQDKQTIPLIQKCMFVYVLYIHSEEKRLMTIPSLPHTLILWTISSQSRIKAVAEKPTKQQKHIQRISVLSLIL